MARQTSKRSLSIDIGPERRKRLERARLQLHLELTEASHRYFERKVLIDTDYEAARRVALRRFYEFEDALRAEARAEARR